MHPPARHASAHVSLEAPDEAAEPASASLAKTCRELAKAFDVRTHEVAVLRVEGAFLRFVYPSPLDKVGCIPLSNLSSIAVRTVLHRKPELFNNFIAVRHASVFESVPISGTKPDPIQKLMSVPLICDHEVVGVLQVSRKASSAGQDFTREDLHKLVHAARSVAPRCRASE